MTPKEWQDNRIVRKTKGWVMRDGFLMDFLNKHYPNKNMRIADLGCGAGQWLLKLKEAGYTNIRGVDLKNFIVFPELKEGEDIFRQCDFNFDKLPFENNAVDFLMSHHAFEHLENGFHFARECSRVLKPGGILVMSFPYGKSIQSRIKFLLRTNVIGWRKENTHINFMTKDIFEKCWQDFYIFRTEYFEGLVSILGRGVYLPANKHFANAVCYFMEKRYNVDYFKDNPYIKR